MDDQLLGLLPGIKPFTAEREMCIRDRCIPFEVPTIEQVGLPVKIGHYFAERPRGFVLVTGPTGCGKSTTLAALVNHVNATSPNHIMTIEDPIEYIHEDKVCLLYTSWERASLAWKRSRVQPPSAPPIFPVSYTHLKHVYNHPIIILTLFS